MITHTKAIILKSVDFQESSKILTVFSAQHGKIALIARGAKKPKSKLSGLIEVGNILDVVYYFKPNRNVQNLTEASTHFSHISFRTDLFKASILYKVLELVTQLVHENEENESLFEFLIQFISWLGNKDQVEPSIFCYSQIRCAELMGFNITFNSDDINNENYFDISHGLITNRITSELSYKLTVLQSRFLYETINTRKTSIFELGLRGGELKQLIHHLDVYFKYHIEDYKDRKSDMIFEQMLQDN